MPVVQKEATGLRRSGGRPLRRGFSTGACAAAAAQAAVQALYGPPPTVGQVLRVASPAGTLALPLAEVEAASNREWARAGVVKDGGDDPDVTSGLLIRVEAWPEDSGITIEGGIGVGVVTKPGLPVAVGQPAINPVPLKMIREAAAAVLPPGEGVRLVVGVPGGEAVAGRTLNARLGIVGGISILGTTGVVEPMSVEALVASLRLGLRQVHGLGQALAVLTPGRQGSRAAEALGLPAEAVALAGNYWGDLLEEAAELGFVGVILVGSPAKLLKVAAGSMNGHNRVADGRQEVLAALAGAAGAGREMVGALLEVVTVDQGLALLEQAGLRQQVLLAAARRAGRRASAYVREAFPVGCVLVAREGLPLAADETALQLARCYLGLNLGRGEAG